MKVYIGPYVYRWTSQVHHKYMCKKYDCMWEKNVDWKDRLMLKLEDALQWIYNHTINLYLDRKERKVQIKLHDYDTWSMDYTLALIIAPMLKQLKATKHGAPLTDYEDRPAHLVPNGDEDMLDDGTDYYHFEAWDWILDEMIWAFEQKCRDDWTSDYIEFEDNPDSVFKIKIKWEDREGRLAHQQRIQNGLRLYGKYYEALWD